MDTHITSESVEQDALIIMYVKRASVMEGRAGRIYFPKMDSF